MEYISVGGEKYVKASSIARELGYTADYVGQLARSGKIEAQLVGRSWFVNERSIQEHKRDRYRSTAAKSREALRESLESFRPSLERSRTPESHFEKRAIYNSLQYEADSHDVLPTIPERELAETSEETVAERGPEQEETAVEEREQLPNEVVHTVPIRTIPDRALKRHTEMRTPVRNVNKPVTAIETSQDRLVVVGEQRGVGTVFAGVLSLLVAVAGLIALIGIEGRIVAQSDSLDTGYQFNMASAIEALYNIER